MLFMVSNYQVFRVSAVDYGAVCQVYFLYMFYSKSIQIDVWILHTVGKGFVDVWFNQLYDLVCLRACLNEEFYKIPPLKNAPFLTPFFRALGLPSANLILSHPLLHHELALAQNLHCSNPSRHYSLLNFIMRKLCSLKPLSFKDLKLRIRIIWLGWYLVVPSFASKPSHPWPPLVIHQGGPMDRGFLFMQKYAQAFLASPYICNVHSICHI